MATTAAAPSSSSTAVTEEADSAESTGGAGGAGGAAFPGDTNADLADPVDPAGLVVTRCGAARHEGYDRVVFELAHTGTPGWSVEYVDTPSSQGEGAAVDVPAPRASR